MSATARCIQLFPPPTSAFQRFSVSAFSFSAFQHFPPQTSAFRISVFLLSAFQHFPPSDPRPPHFSISAFQHFSVSAFQRFSVSAFQRFSVSAFQRFSVSAFQRFSVSYPHHSSTSAFRLSAFQHFSFAAPAAMRSALPPSLPGEVLAVARKEASRSNERYRAVHSAFSPLRLPPSAFQRFSFSAFQRFPPLRPPTSTFQFFSVSAFPFPIILRPPPSAFQHFSISAFHRFPSSPSPFPVSALRSPVSPQSPLTLPLSGLRSPVSGLVFTLPPCSSSLQRDLS
jgi:hypothetical protein